ncbi:hypothetical protein [Methanothermobacter tenebrarum]|uniref:Uncharacterized protein n=1 Tax=Methanothermobacter tenebrarum TaxID=680118 RepID=A0A328PE38_9EURY|nr:hypothetical protein [Methanothermobacter tenebrarum]MBC7101165.1 hypothetical protein [Methanobacteriales archaeon]NPV65107.1 hypothetical protein [Methanobacteriaceae archaeon]RAO79481.1 hypothetical protein DPC56_01490 [Methanothermobacter tenebrarum]
MIKASNETRLVGEPVLQFTGNWIIDLGMLGFVNLLEEIYGWDILETQKRIKENEEIVYYGLFPFAYMCSEIKRKDSTVSKKIIEDFLNEIYKRKFRSKKEIFDFTWENHITKAATSRWKDYITERVVDDKKFISKVSKSLEKLKELIRELEDFEKEFIRKNRDEIKRFLDKKGRFQKFKYKDIKKFRDAPIEKFKEYGEEFIKNAKKFKKLLSKVDRYLDKKWKDEIVGNKDISESTVFRIPIDNKYYKNFLFFQPGYTHEKQKEEFYHAIDFKIEKEDHILNRIDKTINKFLASYRKAVNIYYAPLKTKFFINNIPYLFVYLFCFDRAFEYYRNIDYLVFYSNDIFTTYEINKRLRLRKSKIESEEDPNSIFRGTWQTVIDTIIEMESWWVLENLYLIKYAKLDENTQRFIDVEYMGISRLQATLLLDDDIRRNLNQRVQVDENEYRWLFEEFIKNKSLMPIIMNHLVLRLNQKTKQRKVQPLLYALAVEAELFPAHDFTNLFEDPMLLKAKLDELIPKIKESRKKMGMAMTNIQKLFSKDIRENNAPHLFSIIRRQSKYSFVNSLLRLIISNPEKDKKLIKHLNDYVFHEIVQNDETWIYYALGLFIGFIGGKQ